MNAPKSVMFLTVPLTVLPLFNSAEQLAALLGALGFDELAAAEDDVLALFVQLDDFALEGLAFVNAQVLRGDDIDLGTGQERLDAHVEHEAALDHGLDLAADETAVVEDLDDLFPVLFLGRFFLGEDDHALIVLEALEEHFDFAADFERLAVFKFAEADDAPRTCSRCRRGLHSHVSGAPCP